MTYSRLEINSPSFFWCNEDLVAMTKELPYSYSTHFPYLKEYPEKEAVLEALKEDVGDARIIRYNSRLFHKDDKDRFEPNLALVDLDGKGLLSIHFESMFSLSLHCFSVDQDLRLPAFNKLMEGLTEVPEDNETRWKFVFKTMNGFQTYDRKIICPTVEEIKGNYTNLDSIKWLTELKKPYENGKLIFWYGEPGTGKTYAIRALAREWKNAQFLYITQPESFFRDFGGMYSVLLEHCNEPKAIDEEDEHYKVLVIEDALDLLKKETREKDSSTISRLLNLTEGIIGQGLRILVLITSNEPVKSIDDAFIRPGRCLQMTEFKAFEESDARKWLRNHGVEDWDPKASEDPWTGKMTLAQLYETITKSGAGIEPLQKKRKVAGFQGR